MSGPILHMVLHVAAPAVVARYALRENRLRGFWIMLSALAIDVDHLLAEPIYDPDRCSVGFHPLHSVWAVAAYCGLLLVPKARVLGLGLLLHIALDLVDCAFMR